jgi:DNA-binding MarR family transcriptional regulator
VGEYEFLHFPAEAVHVDPERFAGLPDSAQRVFLAIRDYGPITHVELRARTQIPARTVRFAVKRLKEEGFIDTRCSLRDCRTCYFFVHPRCVGVEALEEARRKADEAATRDHKLIEKL